MKNRPFDHFELVINEDSLHFHITDDMFPAVLDDLKSWKKRYGHFRRNCLQETAETIADYHKQVKLSGGSFYDSRVEAMMLVNVLFIVHYYPEILRFDVDYEGGRVLYSEIRYKINEKTNEIVMVVSDNDLSLKHRGE